MSNKLRPANTLATLVTLMYKSSTGYNTPMSSVGIVDSTAAAAEQQESFRGVRVTATDSGWRDATVNEDGRVIGEHHHSAKLSDADIELILELRDLGLSVREIAAKFDDVPKVSKSMVHAICNGARRRQTVMGHKRVSRRPDFMPADLDEFDIVGGF